MRTDRELRTRLTAPLRWRDAHVDLDTALRGVPARLRGVRPHGLPYSLWELVEHVRLAQRDILDFCRDPAYREPRWPEDYWPASPEPPDPRAWQRSLAAIRADRRELERLFRDPALDLGARIPHGNGQTYLRECLLVADHNAFHAGQVVVLRRLLGIWR